VSSPARERILVIKLGALGDFVLAMGPFAAIRRAHGDAHITLLTIPALTGLARDSGYFDQLWTDTRPSFTQPRAWLALRRKLLGGAFRRVYDLQTSDRSGWYYHLLGPGRRPEWSGIARGCSHPHDNPERDFMHTVERQAEQLAGAGIADVAPDDLSWADADISRFELAERFALLVPGAAPRRPRKRWPVENYAALAAGFADEGVQPVLLGTGAEELIAAEIVRRTPMVKSLVGETTLGDIATLARSAAGAVGNDTGPMHIVAAVGCPAVVLFSAESDPALSRPRGPAVTILQSSDLADLPLDEVAAALSLR
jgi:ADP-heptose:LPS heptosyltransferase